MSISGKDRQPNALEEYRKSGQVTEKNTLIAWQSSLVQLSLHHKTLIWVEQPISGLTQLLSGLRKKHSTNFSVR